MKKRMILLAAACLLIAMTACGTDAEVVAFKEEIDSFCTSVSELDESINNINTEDEDASVTLLEYLDELDEQFQALAEMDFPEDYSYLEPLAEMACSYMSTAVSSYHEAYEGETYDASKAEYAKENSARALKYIQYLLDYLHGEDPGAEATETADSSSSTSRMD